MDFRLQDHAELKALLLNGSPHARGCTFTALSIVAETLGLAGVDAEIIHVGHKNIHGCIGCYKCMETKACVFSDEWFSELMEKFREADALIIGSPVYYAGPNATLCALMDRMFFSAPFDKRMKVGAAVCSARRAGTTATLDRLQKYFTLSEMPIASSRYWPMVHGNSPEEVLKDEEGVQIMRVLGRNVAFLVRAIHAERERNGLPETEPTRISTNFIR